MLGLRMIVLTIEVSSATREISSRPFPVDNPVWYRLRNPEDAILSLVRLFPRTQIHDPRLVLEHSCDFVLRVGYEHLK
jgi:hypothetical protein